VIGFRRGDDLEAKRGVVAQVGAGEQRPPDPDMDAALPVERVRREIPGVHDLEAGERCRRR
jgi:hypothetical protein